MWTDSQVEVALRCVEQNHTPCIMASRPLHIRPPAACSDMLRESIGLGPKNAAEWEYHRLYWRLKDAGIKDPTKFLQSVKGDGQGPSQPDQT